MRRLLVLELNEVPLRLLQWHAKAFPNSATGSLLNKSVVGQSVATDELSRELYPSQTWASLATGVHHDQHGVFWYGDSKPSAFPLYWQVAADSGRSTGIVGTLHSSPMQQQCNQPGVVFAFPDAFAEDANTVPSSLSKLQEFNLAMTQENSRVVADRRPIGRYLGSVEGMARAGVGPVAALELVRLAANVGTGRVPKERLRAGQFHLLADQFTRLGKRFDPDLSVMFSNHIAAAMHRYWYTVFPGDWDYEVYPESWVERFAEEIPYALASLDRWLAKWMRWCEETDRTMLLVSSMGQSGGSHVDTEASPIIVRNAQLFGTALGLPADAVVRQAMVPQVSFSLGSEEEAFDHASRIRSLEATQVSLQIDVQSDRLTVGYDVRLDSSGGDTDPKIEIGGAQFTLEEAGLEQVAVEEHRAGTHHPLGSVVVFNSPTAELPTEPFDYLQIAPAILASLGLAPLEHHQELELSL